MSKKIFRLVLLLTIIFCAVMLVSSCAADESPYGDYNENGYTVSVKYDANGGAFTTNTSVVVDTYDPSKLKTDSDGKLILPLLSPDDAVRGSANAFTATRGGYFLAGWYSERTPVTDAVGNVLDIEGGIAKDTGKDIAYTYSGRWDFENGRVKLDKDKEYTADEPVITLYAAWVKEFSFEFYLGTELISTYKYNPLYVTEIKMPKWNLATGKLDSYQFPKITDKTFNKVFSDAEMTNEIVGETVPALGTLNLENATAVNPTTKLYLDMLDGNWFRISTAEQLSDNASTTGCYEILCDLDFSDEIWPSSFAFRTFQGTINGNGHKISNIKVTQNNTSDQYAGIFGQLAATAKIKNVTFENASVTIAKGTRTTLARYGLLAGAVSQNALLENINITSGTLYINSKLTMPKDIEIGLVTGLGYEYCGGIGYSGIKCEAIVEDNASFALEITVDGNSVSVTLVPKNS